MSDINDINPGTPARHDNVNIGTRKRGRANTNMLNVGTEVLPGTDIPCIIVSSAAPSNGDGRPDGTIYIQTA